MEEKNDNEETFNIKLNLYDELIDLKVNSDYNYFVKNICTILNVSPEQLKSFSLSYNDEDGDSILLSTEEDYTIFFQQVKEKTVNSLIVEIKENKNIDPNACFGSALDYQEQIEQANNQIKNDNNNINNINNSNSGNNINLNNNIFNSNDNIENKHDKIDLDNNQNINNLNSNKESDNNDAQINDLIFEYKCSKCPTYPIICVMYYCPKCSLYLCESCHQVMENHNHPLLKIESKKELQKIKEKENEEIERKKQMQNNQDNFNGFNNPNNQNNNYYPNIYNNNNINYNNENLQFLIPNQNPLFDLIKPFHDFKGKKKKLIRKKEEKIKGFFHQMHKIKQKKLIKKARQNYNLVGITDNQIIEALDKTNGNIDEAILHLVK